MELNKQFIDDIKRTMPLAQASLLIEAITSEPPVTATRYNDAKGFTPPQELDKVPWCETGAYLSERPRFALDPHFHAGSYFVQDASSMFIYHVLKTLVTKPVTYLDLCAAPGGKTTAALQALPEGSTVVANEIMPQRAQILRENVIKWGACNCLVSCDSPAAVGSLHSAFDVIAADVPCSGEGMFRKDTEAVSQWSPSLVEQCSRRQRQVIGDVWSALKPEGLLIYSTCTFNIHENEEIVDFIVNELGASVVDVAIQEQWGISPAIDRAYSCYRFMPHATRGEGLFMCVMRKHHSSIATSTTKRTTQKSKKSCPPPTIASSVNRWVNINHSLLQVNDKIIAVPEFVNPLVATWQNTLHVIKTAGIELGTLKGNKVVPSHQLAMSPHRAPGLFTEVDLDYPTALSYLRGEALTIDAPRGYVAVKHDNATLGWVNNLGPRANNLYPKPWRLRTSH